MGVGATSGDARDAHRVQEVRAVLRIARDELAAYLQVPPWVVRQWEAGRRPVPPLVLSDLRVLEQVGPEIRELLPLGDLVRPGGGRPSVSTEPS